MKYVVALVLLVSLLRPLTALAELPEDAADDFFMVGTFVVANADNDGNSK